MIIHLRIVARLVLRAKEGVRSGLPRLHPSDLQWRDDSQCTLRQSMRSPSRQVNDTSRSIDVWNWAIRVGQIGKDGPRAKWHEC